MTNHLTTLIPQMYAAPVIRLGVIGRIYSTWITDKSMEVVRIVMTSPIIIPLPMTIAKPATVLTVGAVLPEAQYCMPIFPPEAAPVVTTAAWPEASPETIVRPRRSVMCATAALMIGSRMSAVVRPFKVG